MPKLRATKIKGSTVIEGLHERTEYIDISFFPPITQSRTVSDVLSTGGRECQILEF